MKEYTVNLKDNNFFILESKVEQPIAQVLFVHGFFEHVSRYRKEIQLFNDAKIDFIGYDQRSHGKSTGEPRSFISKFDDYLEDFISLKNELALRKDIPLFLLSHSFGGLVVTSYLIQHKEKLNDLKGCVFSAPFLATDENTAPLLQKLAGIVGTLLPKLKVVQLESQHISNRKSEIEAYLNDPLIYTEKIYAGSAWQMIKQIQKVSTRFEAIEIPYLLLHGTSDSIANIKGSQELFNQSKSKDKTFSMLEGEKHEILKDSKCQETLSTIIDWITERA